MRKGNRVIPIPFIPILVILTAIASWVLGYQFLAGVLTALAALEWRGFWLWWDETKAAINSSPD